ncbi:family 2 glycosyl transferase [Rufibacter radiotolerans]|uniref:Family 2 glycosyl transferase n=1 Tax=Rufibacter radiotolerans TaxID=1379910 RepID=A0A0H4VUS8_9BACT|nr:family 2 glycosyl transferase [Rufibacter radiotolerans]
MVPPLQHFPRISILIAARNEEKHILTCLQAIDRLQYPKEKVEVLVGNDRSTDQTQALVEEFAQHHPYVSCLPITYDLRGTKGKPNVLAQLSQKATTDLFFFTDADIEVPVLWIETLLKNLKAETGIVTGITTTKGTRLFDRLQSLDWLYALGLMQVVADRKLPVSSMGNNMLVTRHAYEAVGGYAGIPFSITEDVQLFRQVLAKGYKSANVYCPETLAVSAPAPDLKTLYQQRRRWMRGSFHLPWYMWVLLAIHTAFYPVWIPFFLKAPLAFGTTVYLLKVLCQSVFVHLCLRHAGRKTNWIDLVLLEGYVLFNSVVLLVLLFLPIKIKWKGRQY